MRVVVAAWVGSSNLGDELVFAALAEKLRRRDANVAVLSVDPATTNALHSDVHAIDHRDVVLATRTIRRADLLVFGGGGLLQDETSPLNLPYHLSRVLLARAVGTDVVVLGVGAGPLRSSGRALVRIGLGKNTPVTARDLDSKRLLERVTRCEVSLAADLAFAHRPSTGTPEERFAVALRPPVRRGLTGAARAQATGDWNQRRLRAAAGAIDAVAHRTGLRPHLVALERGRDDRYHQAVAEHLRSSATFATPRLGEVFEEFARSRFAVGMRYHAAVASLLCSRPAVMLSYSPKVASLAREAPGAVFALPDDGWGDVAAAVEEALSVPPQRLSETLEYFRGREAVNDRVLDAAMSGD